MRKAMEVQESEGNTGEHTDSLKALDENAITDKNLINTVEGRMDFLRTLERDADSAESEDVSKTTTPDVPEDEIEEEDDQAAVKAISDDPTPDEKEEKEEEDNEDSKDADGKGGTVTIPDAYVRAAVHQGWDKADVDALVKQNPELALKTLTSCYNSVTNAGKEWSALGRAKIQSEREAAESGTKEQQVTPDVEPLLAKLKESYGDDPLIDVVSKLLKQPVVKAVATAKPATSQRDLYQTATQRANAAADASVDQRVNAFFNNDDMKSYEEFYGRPDLSQTFGDLTNGQQEHRLAVMEEAECILTGLRMRGFDAPIEQVLEKAHLIVTEPIREQVIRSNLKKTAINRKKTLRPAKSKKSGTAVNTGNQQKPKNRQELIDKVGQNLSKVFGH